MPSSVFPRASLLSACFFFLFSPLHRGEIIKIKARSRELFELCSSVEAARKERAIATRSKVKQNKTLTSTNNLVLYPSSFSFRNSRRLGRNPSDAHARGRRGSDIVLFFFRSKNSSIR